jgi:hypothetical protein
MDAALNIRKNYIFDNVEGVPQMLDKTHEIMEEQFIPNDQ